MEPEKSHNNGVLCRLDSKEGKFLGICGSDREHKRLSNVR